MALTSFVWAAEPAYDTLISHRGESHDAPENTLPAYRMAVERGFGFECDIYRSKDGRLFAFHDPDLRRTSGGANAKRCVEASWETDISSLNVGGWGKWKGSVYDPTRPALFEEILALARPGRKIYVEVKGDDPSWVPAIAETLAKEPKATSETVVFITFGERLCAELKRQLPNYKVYLLLGATHDYRIKDSPVWTAEDIIEKLRKVHADGIDIYFFPHVHDAAFVGKLHRAGFSFHVFTVDDAKTARKAFAAGIDTLTTNCAKKILDEVSGI